MKFLLPLVLCFFCACASSNKQNVEDPEIQETANDTFSEADINDDYLEDLSLQSQILSIDKQISHINAMVDSAKARLGNNIQQEETDEEDALKLSLEAEIFSYENQLQSLQSRRQDLEKQKKKL